MPVCIRIKNFLYVRFFRDFNCESACVDGLVTLAHVIKVLRARGFEILDSIYTLLWLVSIALGTSLHMSLHTNSNE